MKWAAQNADESVCDEPGSAIRCSGCHKTLQGSDVCSVAHSLTDDEAEGTREMFDVEPFGGGVAVGNAPIFCDDCLLGLSADPDAWFRERMRMHAAKKLANEVWKHHLLHTTHARRPAHARPETYCLRPGASHRLPRIVAADAFLARSRGVSYTGRSYGTTTKEAACIEMANTNGRIILGLLLGLAGVLSISAILQATEVEAIYYDRFDDPGSGWLEDEGDTGSVSYRNGKYQVQLTRDYYVWWSWAPYDDVPDSFIVEISGYARDQRGFSYYGIIWGIDDDNFLLFTITPTGWFSVQSQLGGKWQRPPIDWKESRSIKQGEGVSNTLRVTVEGDTVAVRINNGNVGTFEMGASSDLAVVTSTPTTVRRGATDTWLVGLAAGAFDQVPVRIYFDEFALYELASPSTDDRPSINIGGG